MEGVSPESITTIHLPPRTSQPRGLSVAPAVFDTVGEELSEEYGAVFGHDGQPKQVIDRSTLF
ncbi:MAG: hypothetical protein J07HQX50_01644 [Haloquadratum sp. J07HQX50]|nr:MAG: hypothetical protein J07HQX50_01644 [Haloquadratum sp. J07HQX50]